jgi:hypothetical protein
MNIGDYLPLSQRPKVDESRVTSNWARPTGELLLAVAESLESASPADCALPAGRSTVRGTAIDLLGALAPRGSARHAPPPNDAELAARLRESAMIRLTGHPKTPVRVLGTVLVAALDVSRALGTPLTVDATLTGAVALARAGSAPFAIRAVVKARTLVADDHGWRVGFGPELHGTGEAIVLFLYGRGEPPR